MTRGALAQSLWVEWQQLRRRPTACEQATGWQIIDGQVDDLDDVLHAIGFERPPHPAYDRALRRLVDRAASDDLAARVIVQRLIPGILAIVRRRGRHHAGTQAFEELLGALWIAVRTFNPDRRPSCLAAALLSDADYRVFRAPNRRRSSGEVPVDMSQLPIAGPTDRSSDDELADVLELARDAGFNEDDLDLIDRLLAADSPADVARALEVTPRTIRNRRQRITRRLRDLATAA